MEPNFTFDSIFDVNEEESIHYQSSWDMHYQKGNNAKTQSTMSTPLSTSQESNCSSVLDKMEDIPEEPERKVDMHNIRIKAWKLCKNYLTGIWKQVKSDDLILTEICEGLSNLIFLVGLPQHIKTHDREPRQVLLRIFGSTLKQLNEETPESFITGIVIENVIFTILSERKLGPKLFGVFAGGRIEEYIPSKSLTASQLRKKAISHALSRKFARIHKLSVPINTDARWLFQTMEKWQEAIAAVSLDDICDIRERNCAARMLDINFVEEIAWLKKWVAYVNSPIIFCHNDLQGGNILLRNDLGDSDDNMDAKLIVIDYEFCSYNYRAFDIANHFQEWMYDYTNKSYPYYYIAKDKFPSKETRLEFLKTYYDETLVGSPKALSLTNEDRQQQAEALQLEVEAFLVVPNLLWALWSISQSVSTKITFGYWYYAEERMQYYFHFKESCNSMKIDH